MKRLATLLCCSVLLFGTAAGCSSSSDDGQTDAVADLPDNPADTVSEDGGADTAIPDVVAEDTAPELTPDGTVETVEDLAADVPWTPPFDPTVCETQPHTWLPPEGMGEIVMSEETLFTNVTPETVDSLVEEAGYGDFGKAKYGARNFKIRYVTQDRGQLVEATAVVGVPIGEDLQWPAPVMVWLHGTTGFMDDCAPSADPLMGPGTTSLWAAQGYVTVAPDYIGMLGYGEKSPAGTIHPYLVGEATAIASLDSIRALAQFLEANPDLGSADLDQVVLLGGSQGGHAALFTELYWPYYAPEMTLRAVVAAVPPANLIGQASYALSDLVSGTGNLLSAMVAMKNWYGQPEDLSGLFTNEEPYFLADNVEGWMSGSCSPDVDLGNVDEVTDGFLPAIVEAATNGDWDAIPPWGCYLRENSIPGTSVVRVTDTPFLTTFSEEDTLVLTSIEKENWPSMCEMGYRMEYLECAGLGHSKGALAALPYARVWLEERLAGLEWDADKICVMQEPVDCSTIP